MNLVSLVSDPSAGQNCAFFTFDMLANTLNGVTSPTTVTFFAAKSMLKEVTPAHKINKIKISYLNSTQKMCDIFIDRSILN